ncbi:MAG: hypothetical protein LBT63_01425 [Holosporaceae bacterium]|nr:hypothetical protein [Holosporaceae bacterium]
MKRLALATALLLAANSLEGMERFREETGISMENVKVGFYPSLSVFKKNAKKEDLSFLYGECFGRRGKNNKFKWKRYIKYATKLIIKHINPDHIEHLIEYLNLNKKRGNTITIPLTVPHNAVYKNSNGKVFLFKVCKVELELDKERKKCRSVRPRIK